ncbi:MAG TPA: GNAT family N-acetyltransferase [Bacteroidales bacterium]|jgi:GNAT superfamily N-acetyltransferase|nr:GNAT family N-acetyltransferase [Bacteroidales bacterium]HNZ43408.1 GNAT family N-acetyltransferase [Bacteroidales bacterium]HOH83592.1 GNAT family N-acetyltransferase [Bacteroidales bacterium]HPB26122.1 GNAT family N-acetyltransferase [Bacteroidales bacterium]HPI31015.1 GNAT family N-acetyltransferase [Bacteroidales bacterium]
MNDITIHAVTEKDLDIIARVKELFTAMYHEYAGMGLSITLPGNSAALWMNSVLPALNRMNMLYVALVEGEVAGFIFGYFNFTRDYLGATKTGVISETYVVPHLRSKGVGRILLGAMEKWFIEKGIATVELQTLYRNEKAVAFWEKAGYTKESIHFRKLSLTHGN